MCMVESNSEPCTFYPRFSCFSQRDPNPCPTMALKEGCWSWSCSKSMDRLTWLHITLYEAVTSLEDLGCLQDSSRFCTDES